LPEPIVIVGGGLASARLVAAYRRLGGDSEMILISADSEPPYHRPPLSKAYLRGEKERADVLVEEPGFYREHRVDLRLRTVAQSIDTVGRAVALESGRAVRYGTLVLATGAVPRRLKIRGSELENVFYLRTMDDSTAIREAAREASRALVVGGSFIGTEVAASLSQRGLEVTLVHRGEGLHDQLGFPELSEFLARVFGELGVEVRLRDELVGLQGNGRVSHAELGSGERLECDLVVVGVGVDPATDLVRDTKIESRDGILVDTRLRTSVEDVYALGDVARFYDPVLGALRRIEHWDNANYQGDLVGRLLAGDQAQPSYDHVSMFFTDVFDITLEVYGDVAEHDRVVRRGDFAERDVVAAYLDREDRLVAALALGQDEETTTALQTLLEVRATLASEQAFHDKSERLTNAFRLGTSSPSPA
jgi:NADPH-dependent 2,4-dienoyl-CoA reductase/sulfur reductase-like enzyme